MTLDVRLKRVKKQSRTCNMLENEPATMPTTPAAQQTTGNSNTGQGTGGGGNNNNQGTSPNNNNDKNGRGQNGGANNKNDGNASSTSGMNPQHFRGVCKDLNFVLGMPNERINAKYQYNVFTEKLANHILSTFENGSNVISIIRDIVHPKAAMEKRYLPADEDEDELKLNR